MKILVLTSIYPQADDDKNAGITPVVHYFTKEWVKDNNDVIVIHNSNRYPQIFYKLSDKMIQKINSKLGIVVPKSSQGEVLESIVDGVKVIRMPMLKVIPRTRFNKRQINNQYKLIVEYIKKNNFKPDIIIGHWENPQVPLISMLKKTYLCKSALVFHGLNYLDKKAAYKWRREYLNDIDVIGCRSSSMAYEIKEKLNLQNTPFVCYSGIPTSYISNEIEFLNNKTYVKEIEKYIFVGQLIERKHIDTIIEALCKCYVNKNFELNIVGIGYCEEKLKNLAGKLDITENVKFLGRKERDEVIELMEKAQCFTMVSENEVFGLVYLEAMSKGCIVVASRNEGMDSIIIDGVNGFLCEAGNSEELELIYGRINNMTKEEKYKISEKAIETAMMFTDEAVARKYLENVLIK